jgi:hypothetical protein
MLNDKTQVIKFIENVFIHVPKEIIDIVYKQLFDENDNLMMPVEPMAIIRMVANEIN